MHQHIALQHSLSIVFDYIQTSHRRMSTMRARVLTKKNLNNIHCAWLIIHLMRDWFPISKKALFDFYHFFFRQYEFVCCSSSTSDIFIALTVKSALFLFRGPCNWPSTWYVVQARLLWKVPRDENKEKENRRKKKLYQEECNVVNGVWKQHRTVPIIIIVRCRARRLVAPFLVREFCGGARERFLSKVLMFCRHTSRASRRRVFYSIETFPPIWFGSLNARESGENFVFRLER